MLHGADDDVRTFAETADRSVIETATPYAALRDVDTGVQAAEIRRVLKSQSGRLERT